jgi:hypothetical protein
VTSALPTEDTSAAMVSSGQRELKWQDGIAVPQSQSIPQDIWEVHKRVVSTKYHGLTLTEPMRFMKEEYDFTARCVSILAEMLSRSSLLLPIVGLHITTNLHVGD